MFSIEQIRDKFMDKIDLPEQAVVAQGSGFGQILINFTLGAEGVEATEEMLAELGEETRCRVGISDNEQGEDLFDTARINIAPQTGSTPIFQTGQQIESASYEVQGLDCESVELSELVRGLKGFVNWTSCYVVRKQNDRGKYLLVLRISGWSPSVVPVADSDEAREASDVATAAVRWAVDRFVWKVVRTYVNPHFVRPNEPEVGRHNISLEVRAPVARYDEYGEIRTVWTGPKVEESVYKDGAILYGSNGQPRTRKTNKGRASGSLFAEARMTVQDGVIVLHK